MRFVNRAWTNSLSFKVILAYVAGVVLSVLIIVLVIKGLLAFRSPILLEEDVKENAEGLGKHMKFGASGAPVGFDEKHAWVFETMKEEVAYRVLDSSGRVVLQSQAGDGFWPSNSGQAGAPKPGRIDFSRAGTPFQGATAVIEHGGRQWFFQMANSARLAELIRLEFALPFMGIGIGLFSAVLLFVFGICAFITLHHVQKPLQELSTAAAAISPRSLHARLQSERAPIEIAPLVESFNRVLERLEHGYRVQQEFLATAAHELKTPLALIRAQIELTHPGGERDALLRDVAHMTRQVQQLLLLAEASEAHNYGFAPIDVLDVAREAADYLDRMAQATQVRIELTSQAGSIEWNADRGALFTLLKNLLENAVQHAPAGTAIAIDVDATTLSVRDFGPGVTPDQLAKLFARFWRGAHRRDHGAGLGLAICQEIAQAHGWRLTAHHGDPGLRLEVSIVK
ncbi:signal transduction histidine kinase [Pelomonas saccharophila]|uniref:histidine kinase n=1 Tax=Roseateles saccharophilus TaxID=304 RepID=A0ABU1YI77_ROSSA|nr:ATP-binding protein [Roseateles saccharophilus]MDR7268559.1 signal transduction histidine kinase [Roseateles saccharophilus]